MKKDENQKTNHLVLKDSDTRSRSQSPKAYLGCDTCKLKNSDPSKVKSISKLSDCGNVFDKNKFKKPSVEKMEKGLKKTKIKLTDLCDEDKKRIIDLIEELSKLAETNQELQESLDSMEKNKQEQQEYILKQANSHLEEKNFYINEINEHKTRIEALENEMKNKTFKWDTHERRKDTEIAYLAKALQRILKEKQVMNDQLTHLKTCLRHSLESFQRLRNEVTDLQRQEREIRKYKSASCQTEFNIETPKEKCQPSNADSEEDFLSTCSPDPINVKSSLDIINDKLEYVYQLLKRKSESFAKNSSQKFDIDLSILLKKGKIEEGTNENCQVSEDPLKAQSDEDKSGNRYKFLKPFDLTSKTSIQNETVLKKIGKPPNLTTKEGAQKSNTNTPTNFTAKEPPDDAEPHQNILQKKIVQKNNLFKSSEEYQYDEDRLLEELFYSDHSLNFGLDSILKLETQDSLFE